MLSKRAPSILKMEDKMTNSEDSSKIKSGIDTPIPKPNHAIIKMKEKETGIGLKCMNHVKYKLTNDPYRQITEFFTEFHIPAGTGIKRKVAPATTKAYRDRLATFLDTAQKLNLTILNLDEISPAIVKLVFLQLEKDGASAAWLANVNTTVRRFGVWIGKPDLCPEISKLISCDGNAERKHSIPAPKNWEFIDIETEEIISKVGVNCEITSLQLTLAKNFGLSMQEVLMLKPNRCEYPPGYILLTGEAKGGRSRVIPIETQEQRQAINDAKAISIHHPRGHLIAKPGQTLQQATRYFYRQMEKIGVTKANKGITTYGLRCGYACRSYQLLTGQLPPLLGGGVVDPHLDKMARTDISQRLGHGRMDVINAYIGSHNDVARSKKKSLQLLIATMESDMEIKHLAKAAQMAEIYILGAIADGQSIGRGSNIALGFVAELREGETQYQADERAMGGMFRLSIRMGQMLGATVSSTPLSSALENTSRFQLTGLSSLLLNKMEGL